MCWVLGTPKARTFLEGSSSVQSTFYVLCPHFCNNSKLCNPKCSHFTGKDVETEKLSNVSTVTQLTTDSSTVNKTQASWGCKLNSYSVCCVQREQGAW